MDTITELSPPAAKVRRNWPLVVLATIAVILLLNFGAPFFIPLFVALLIAFSLSPVVDLFTRIVRFRVVAAAVVVFAVLAALGAAAWTWSDEVVTIWEKVPVAAKSISKSLQRYAQKPSGPMAEVKKAAAEIENVAQGGPAASAGALAAPAPAPAPPAAGPSALPVWQLLWTGGKGVAIALSQVVVVVFLVFFMLASGNLFKRKIVALSGGRLTQRKVTVEMLDEIDNQIRRYLMVLVVSNLLVGTGTWLVFHSAGLEYAGLWGFVAAVLHTIPYFGSALVAAGSLVVAFVQFDDWGKAFLVAGSSVVVATIVGNIFSTWLASRQTKMNATATFVGLLFFAWIWGFWGLLLGIPILAIVKTICDHNEGWKPVSELLGQ
jgi:predicted PurR-regulated permease PerM